MMTKFVRMHLPNLGGAQNVNATEVDLWIWKGGMVLPDLTPDEIADAAARTKADEVSRKTAEDAQASANDLARKELEATLAAENALVSVAPKAALPSKPIVAAPDASK